ncbi:hypothetical protein TWF694_011241 [Orbilia ellipsospora]|uniref:Uncharacterized protein n=1 Tax=Orbilia ellipsospora TaxID=2528407 RepID=A0AAV9X9P6_9PEZI
MDNLYKISSYETRIVSTRIQNIEESNDGKDDGNESPQPSRGLQIEYDTENYSAVNIAPLALTWEKLNMNRPKPAYDNPWIIPEGDAREKFDRYAKDVHIVQKDIGEKLQRLGMLVVPKVLSVPILNFEQEFEDNEGLQEMGRFFERQVQMDGRGRHFDARFGSKYFVKDRSGVGEDLGIYDSSKAADSNDMNVFEKRFTTALEDAFLPESIVQGAQAIAIEEDVRTFSLEASTPKPRDINKTNEGLQVILAALLEAVIRNLMIKTIEIKDKKVTRDTPRYFLEIIWRHARRQEYQKKLIRYSLNHPRPTKISFNVEHLYDKYYDHNEATSGRDLFPIFTNLDPETRKVLNEAQRRMVFALELLRKEWYRLNYLEYLKFPEYQKLYNEHGHNIQIPAIRAFALKTPITRRHFDNLTPRHKAILELGVKLVMEPLSQDPLEQDMEQMLQHAIFEFITATEREHKQVRESLLIAWEMRLMCSKWWPEPNKKKPCSCYCRDHILKVIKKYNLRYPYTTFFAEKCIKDYPAVNALIEQFEDPRKPPHPLEEIDVDIVTYIDVPTALPVWMVNRQNLILAIIKHLRTCVATKNDCHASALDHGELLMKVIWGRGWDSKDCKHRKRYETYLVQIVMMISERWDERFESQWELFVTDLKKWDILHFKYRRIWCQIYCGEELKGTDLENAKADAIAHRDAGLKADQIGVDIFGKEGETLKEKGWMEIKEVETAKAESMQLATLPKIDPKVQKERFARARREYFTKMRKDLAEVLSKKNKEEQAHKERQPKKSEERKLPRRGRYEATHSWLEIEKEHEKRRKEDENWKFR